MTASTLKTALDNLATLLDAISGPTFRRNAILPERIPAAGLMILRDGERPEPYEVTVGITPVYSYKAMPSLEIYVQEADQATRDTLMDDYLQAVATALAGDPTLSGAVIRAFPQSPENHDDVFDGAEQVRAERLPIELDYDTTNPLT